MKHAMLVNSGFSPGKGTRENFARGIRKPGNLSCRIRNPRL